MISTNELCDFINGLAPEVVEGALTWTPYSIKGKQHPYVVITQSGIKEECESQCPVSNIEDAINLFKHHAIKYCADSKRIIVRSWPYIEKIHNLTREKPLYCIRCRLIADDGMAELSKGESAA